MIPQLQPCDCCRFMKLRNLLITLFLVISANSSRGQVSLRSDFDLSDALENNAVLTIEVDHRGGVWIGKQNGLVYYNGLSITPIKGTSTEARLLRNAIVNRILEAPDHSLWVAAQGHLFHHDPRSGETQAYPTNGPGITMAYDLCFATDSSLWVSNSGGVWHIENELITDTITLPSTEAFPFYRGLNDRAFLRQIHPNSDIELPFTILEKDPVFKRIGPQSPEWSVNRLRVNDMLYGIVGDSLLRGFNEYRMFWVDSTGRWYISVGRPGASYTWEPTSGAPPKLFHPVGFTNIRSAGDGAFWISALTAGLVRGQLGPTPYEEVVIRNPQGEPLSTIHSLYASDGHLYIGTTKGLYRCFQTPSGNWTQDPLFRAFPGSSIAHIHAVYDHLILSDHDGLWYWPLGNTDPSLNYRLSLPESVSSDRVYKYVSTQVGDFITTRTGVYPVANRQLGEPLPGTNGWLTYDVLYSQSSESLWVVAREGVARYVHEREQWAFDTLFSP